MQKKFRLYRRGAGVFYWQENGTANRGSLRTKNRAEAEELIRAKNEAQWQPTLNLALGRAFLSAHDPQMTGRTWHRVMDEMASHGEESTRLRCRRAMRCSAYEPLRNKALVQTPNGDLLMNLRTANHSVAFYLRWLHNLALDLGSCRGPYSQNPHGRKSTRKSAAPSWSRSRTQGAAHSTNALVHRSRAIRRRRTHGGKKTIGGKTCSATDAGSLARTANLHGSPSAPSSGRCSSPFRKTATCSRPSKQCPRQIAPRNLAADARCTV